MSNGVVVVDGVKLDISAIELRDGRIQVVASATGPIRSVVADCVTIFGKDGRGVAQIESHVEWPELGSGSWLSMFLPIRVIQG